MVDLWKKKKILGKPTFETDKQIPRDQTSSDLPSYIATRFQLEMNYVNSRQSNTDEK